MATTIAAMPPMKSFAQTRSLALLKVSDVFRRADGVFLVVFISLVFFVVRFLNIRITVPKSYILLQKNIDKMNFFLPCR